MHQPLQTLEVPTLTGAIAAGPRTLASRLLRDRMLRTIAMALPLVVLVGLLPKRPATFVELGITQRQMYEMKYAWPAAFDMVLTGNSRVTAGLAPSEMQAVLAGYHIANFGFDGNAFTREYLEAAAAKLSPGSAHRVIVLGITPMTFTDRAARQNGFIEEQHRSLDDRLLQRHFPAVLDFFTRFNPKVAVTWFTGDRQVAREFWHGYPDGWGAESMQPPNLMNQVQFLRANARTGGYPVSRPLLDDLFSTVRTWRARRIRAVAFRAPTTVALAHEEERASGFDQTAFTREFVAAGGTWIEIDAGRYETFDGGHLIEAAARQLSRDLASTLLSRGVLEP